MAVTNNNNNLIVKRWETETWLETIQRKVYGHLLKRGIIYFAPDFLGSKSRGDELTFGFASKLKAIPVGAGGTVTGNSEALDLQSYKMAIDVCRVSVNSPNIDTIEQQRTYVNFEEIGRAQLSQRVRELIETSIFYQAAGANPTSIAVDGTTYTSTDRRFVQGLNTIVPPTSERILRAGGAANDQSLTSSNIMTFDLIDAMIEMAETTQQPLERLDDDDFDLFLHPYQITDLKRDTTSKVQWFPIQLANAASGNNTYLEKGIHDGMISLGRYNNVNIYSSSRIATGVNSSNSAAINTVRRAVLFGRKALSFASPYGGRLTDKDVPVKFHFEEYDMQYFKAVEARMIYGIKKISHSNKQDYGTIVCSTYAAAHTI